jgi:hypothetical protein
MTTLELIVALATAVRRNDTRATSRLLDELEARLPLEEVIEILEDVAGDVPIPLVPSRALCA